MSVSKLASSVLAMGVLVSASACNKGETTVKGVDTTVVTSKVRDTTIVKADTTIHVDTVKKTHNVPGAKP